MKVLLKEQSSTEELLTNKKEGGGKIGQIQIASWCLQVLKLF